MGATARNPFRPTEKYEDVFGTYCSGEVSSRFRNSTNRGRIAFVGCAYSRAAREEIEAEGISVSFQVGVTAEELKALMPRLSSGLARHYAPLLNAAMREFQIDNAQRRNLFLAQVAHESWDLTRFKERTGRKSPKENFKKYDSRKDLGNFLPSDGARFRGRVPIQVTGRANYEKVGRLLKLDLVNHPELLEDPVHAIRASACWWKMNGLNQHLNKHPFDILGASVVVNGVDKKSKLPDHLQERQKRFISISKFLGIRMVDQLPGGW